MIYVLKGNPIPLARARTSYVLRRNYDGQKAQKMITGIDLQCQRNDEPFLKGPLLFKCTFYLPIPTSISKKKRDYYFNRYHIARPDTDNLIKYILDVCQGIFYEADSIVAKIEAEKRYCLAQDTRTEFEFIELKGE